MILTNKFDTNNQSRLGVHFIGDFFERNGWYFRERPTPDVGIDADVEENVGGKVSSRHLALQIKSGPAFLKRKKNGKISFAIDKWHYDYWLASDRPVIIMIYDAESKAVYWEQVRLYSLKRSKKNWMLEINPSNILVPESLSGFSHIIDSYKPHQIVPFDEESVSFDISIMSIQEFSNSLNVLTQDLENFHNKIKQQISAPNAKTLQLHINVFVQKLKRHIDDDYQLLHTSCWYLAYFALRCPKELDQQFVENIDNYIGILLSIKTSWSFNAENFKKFQHGNFPSQVKTSGHNLVRVVEDYIALIDLSIEDFLTCKYLNQNKNEQT